MPGNLFSQEDSETSVKRGHNRLKVKICSARITAEQQRIVDVTPGTLASQAILKLGHLPSWAFKACIQRRCWSERAAMKSLSMSREPDAWVQWVCSSRDVTAAQQQPQHSSMLSVPAYEWCMPVCFCLLYKACLAQRQPAIFLWLCSQLAAAAHLQPPC